jgi:hypothetical protein
MTPKTIRVLMVEDRQGQAERMFLDNAAWEGAAERVATTTTG